MPNQFFEPLNNCGDHTDPVIDNTIIPVRANPWAAAIDGLGRTAPDLSVTALAFGSNFTQTPEYAAANPPPYVSAKAQPFLQHFLNS